jgi:signal transduction histidine kinase
MIPPEPTPGGLAKLSMPLASSQARGGGPISPGGTPDLSEAEARRSKRILVVEDDPPIQGALAVLLGDEGYEVSVAGDGEEALDRMEADDTLPDLILLDLRMPVMDGWEFRTAQRRDSRLATIPVVAISADGSSRAAAISAQAFLRKPVDADELLATIERVLSEDEQRRRSIQWKQVERLASLGRVTAGVGHEINNPLSFVLLNVALAQQRLRTLDQKAAAAEPANALAQAEVRQLIKKELLEVQDALADSLIGLDRIRDIVRNLQSLSSRPDGKWEAVQLEKVLDESLAMARNQIQHRALITKRYGVVPEVTGNASALGQVFLNLLINAAQAIPEGAAAHNEIAVVTSFDGVNVLVEIGDTGQGIAADVLPHVFDPFFTTKSANEGTGLGLAICQQIIKEHGGRLAILSEPGNGTVCSVYLRPVGVSQGASTLPAKGPPGLAASRSARRGRILVIDDEPMIGRVIASVLADRHEVVAVQRAQEAFDRLEAGEWFDLVLCDLLMPNIGGPEVHDTFVSRWPALLPRLVFMTGGAFSQEATAFLARTLCPMLYKPFVAKELEDLVNAHLGHHARIEPS